MKLLLLSIPVVVFLFGSTSARTAETPEALATKAAKAWLIAVDDGGGVKLIQFGGLKLIHPFVQ